MKHPKSERVIDARGLEPPEPFVLTMDALDALPKGEKLLLLLYREPYPLYKALANNGFRHEVEQLVDGTVEILIWHASD
jgi:tRNA 2-thiouridine synthesizing protein A